MCRSFSIPNLLFFLFYASSSWSDIQVEVLGESLGNSLTSSSVESFSSDVVERSSATDLGSFLRSQGVSVVRQGGAGHLTDLYLRGGDADHILVLVDGVPMNDPSNPDRRFDFSRLPLSEIERIEISKGGQSVLHGSEALAGVVEIWTKTEGDRRGFRGGVKTGSFSSSETHGSMSQNLNSSVSFSLGGQWYESEGYSSASGGSEKDGNRGLSGSLSSSWNPNPQLRASYSLRRVDQKTELDRGGGGLNDDPNFVSLFRQDTHSLGLQFFSTSNIAMQGHWADSNIWRRDENKADSSSNENLWSDYWGNQKRVDFKVDILGNPLFLIRTGAGYTREAARGVSITDGVRSDFPQSSAEENEVFLHLSGEKSFWFYEAGARWEDHSEFGGEPSSEVGVGYRWALNQRLSLRTSRSTKWPSLSQLFDPLYGNSELEPERMRSVELNWKGSWSVVEGELSFFENKYRDLIGYDSNFRSLNEGKSRVRGIETEAKFANRAGVTQIKYQYLDPMNLETSEVLLRRARHEIFISQTWEKEQWFVQLWMRYRAYRYDMDPEAFTTLRMPDYKVLGALLRYQWKPGMMLWAEAENLANTTYEEVAGYQATPRAYWLGMEIDL